MRRGIVFVGLLLIALVVVGFQTGAYNEFRRLFLQNPGASHTSGNHNSSGSSGNNSNSNSSSSGNNSNSTSNQNYLQVNTIINYGNATTVWFNKTKAPLGWNFYNLTLYLANGRVHVLYSSIYKENQVLGINGKEQSSTSYWSLWKFCPSYNAWAWSPVGADEIALSNGGTYGWYYQDYNTQYPPVPGSSAIVILDISSC